MLGWVRKTEPGIISVWMLTWSLPQLRGSKIVVTDATVNCHHQRISHLRHVVLLCKKFQKLRVDKRRIIRLITALSVMPGKVRTITIQLSDCDAASGIRSRDLTVAAVVDGTTETASVAHHLNCKPFCQALKPRYSWREMAYRWGHVEHDIWGSVGNDAGRWNTKSFAVCRASSRRPVSEWRLL